MSLKKSATFFFSQKEFLKFFFCMLCVYMCEAPSWKLEPWPLPLTPHKHLYLWSDYHTEGVWWCVLAFLIPYSLDWNKITSWLITRYLTIGWFSWSMVLIPFMTQTWLQTGHICLAPSINCVYIYVLNLSMEIHKLMWIKIFRRFNCQFKFVYCSS